MLWCVKRVNLSTLCYDLKAKSRDIMLASGFRVVFGAELLADGHRAGSAECSDV